MFHFAFTDSLFSQTGDEIMVTQEIKVICQHEIVVALSFFVPVEKRQSEVERK